MRLNRDFAHAQMSLALQTMADILQGCATNRDVCLSHYGRVGDLMRQLDHFQVRFLQKFVLISRDFMLMELELF